MKKKKVVELIIASGITSTAIVTGVVTSAIVKNDGINNSIVMSDKSQELRTDGEEKANLIREDEASSRNLITIPDKNLEDELNKALGQSPGSLITQSQLEGLKSLTLNSKKILNLEGIQYCLNVTSLQLNNNQISDISPLTSLEILRDLYLANNQISDISPLANLTTSNLQDLVLMNNQISDISPLTSLINLQTLYLNNNQISDILPLSSFTEFGYLFLDNNQISDFSAIRNINYRSSASFRDQHIYAAKSIDSKGKRVEVLNPFINSDGLPIEPTSNDGGSYNISKNSMVWNNISSDKTVTMTFKFSLQMGGKTAVASAIFEQPVVYTKGDSPIISGLSDITIRKGKMADIQVGVTAEDNEDGDITGSIVYPTIDLTTLPEGTHEIEYSVTDSDGNTTVAKRKVIVESNNSPVINGVDDITIKVGEVDSFNNLAGVAVTDDHDTGLVPAVTGTVGKPAPGTNETYELVYTVTDSDGNTTEVRRNVTVTNQVPTISGLDDITLRERYTADVQAGVTAGDNEDGDITGRIVYPTTDLTKLSEGTHEIEYSVTDSDGNTTVAKRKVIVKSNNAPVINGADDITIKVGYVDSFNNLAGVTVTDDHDTGLVPAVTGTVGKPEPGTNETYELVYTVTDSDGNTTVVKRNVTVTNQVPTISGLDEITIVEKTTVDLKAGVIAEDNEDGDITGSIDYPTIDLTTLSVGTHEIEYSVTDSDGNTTTAKRVITVLPKMEELNSIPAISANDITIKVGDKYNPLLGVTANDEEDGDLTESIKVIENTVDTTKVGIYKVVYEVTDSNGAKATKTIAVIVRSNEKPVISGADDTSIVEGANFDQLLGLSAKDLEDGDLTAAIKVTGKVDINKVDIYELTYTVTDSDGNTTTVKRVITVLPKMEELNFIPTISANDITIKVGDKYNPLLGVTANDEEDGDLTGSIKVIENTVDVTKVGVYKVVYEVADSNGAKATKTIAVTVRSNEKPAISGADDTSIVEGTIFNPLLGVSAKDLEDGDLTGAIKVTGIVDINKSGTYELTYMVADSDGNTTTAKRIVKVTQKELEVVTTPPTDNKPNETDKVEVNITDVTDNKEYGNKGNHNGEVQELEGSNEDNHNKNEKPKKDISKPEFGSEDDRKCYIHWILLALAALAGVGTYIDRKRYERKITIIHILQKGNLGYLNINEMIENVNEYGVVLKRNVVDSVLLGLVEKGFVIEEQVESNGVIENRYKTTKSGEEYLSKLLK